MTCTLPAGHALEGRVDLIIAAGEQVDQATTGIPTSKRRLARCDGDCAHRGGRVGLVWAAAHGMTLGLMRCPVCDGAVRQTTNSFRARFYRLTPAYVAELAKAGKAAAKAAAAERRAAGLSKRVADLEPGDVIRVHSFGSAPVRVVEVLGPGRGRSGHKTQTAVTVARLARTIERHQPWSTRTIELRAAGDVELVETADAWADLEPGSALLRLAREEVLAARRLLDQAKRNVARAHNREQAARYYHVDERATELAKAALVADRLELAANAAGLGQ